MRSLFYEVIREAKNGKVCIDGEEWGISFNTIIYENGKQKEEHFNDQNLSTLVIKNEEKFFPLLEEYIAREIDANRRCMWFSNNELDTRIKFILAYLFANASTEEFLDPENMLRRRIDFLDDNSFEYLNDGKFIALENAFGNSNIFIKRSSQSVMMETPWKIEVSLCKFIDDEMLNAPLAEVSYGIREENGEKVCYVYSMMKPKEKKESSDMEKLFKKRLNRELYKLNEGVLEQESEEFRRYKDRWDKLSRSIETVNKDIESIHVTTDKISKRFDSISRVEIKDRDMIE